MTRFGSPSIVRSQGWYLRCDRSEPAACETMSSPAVWPAVGLLALLTIGCTSLQPSPALPPTPLEAPAPIAAEPREPMCSRCAALQIDIAQLQRQLANRESELSDLRARRLEQAKALEESARQVARAKARLKRLATRATAASYIAEVEASATAANSASGLASEYAKLALAQTILDSSAELFARGDYDAAIDRADQAAEMIAKASEQPPRPRTRRAAIVHFGKAKPLRVRIDSNLRKGPSRKAEARDVLKAGTPVVAHARRGGWLRVGTADGRAGWVYRPLLGPR